MFKMRFLPVSLTSMLVELASLEDTLALLTSLQTTPVTGIDEMVPAACTLLIRFQPEEVTATQLASELGKRELSTSLIRSNRLIEIPVCYDGEDREHVADLTGLSVKEVIHRHT